jgi:hypothetical protein
MSLFNRFAVYDGGLQRKHLPTEGIQPVIRSVDYATDAAYTLTIPDIVGGCFRVTGFTAGRNLTTPTAAQITAAAPDMGVGDSFTFMVSMTVAFAATWVAGTGITLAGRGTCPASVISFVEVIKVSDTAYTWKCL